MERKQIVSRLGMGMQVVIVRARFFHKGTAMMRLQVIRRRGWRTVSAKRVPELDANERRATQWMYDYETRPAGHFRRHP